MKHALALALVVAACGNDVHHGVDAPPADVSVDTVGPSSGDPPADAIKLTITRGGMPVVGVAVVFQNADSSLVHAALTNETGLAWAEMASGGFVTAMEHRGDGLDELTTFADVQLADALELAFDPTGPTDEWPVLVAVPADTGAAGYQVYTTCGGPFGADPAEPALSMLVGCGGVTDAVVVSEDDQNAPRAAFHLADLVVPAAIPPMYGTLNLAGTYAPLVAKSFSYSNVPTEISFVATYHSFLSSHGRLYERTDGAAVSAGTAATSIAVPSANAMSLVVTAPYSSTDVGAQLIYDPRAAGAPAYTLDVGGALLPPFATQPVFDTATRTVTWTERGGQQQPDLVRARVHIYRDDIPSGRAWGWKMVAPRTATAVKYPELPVFGFDFNPRSDDITGVSELTCADVPGDYATARRVGFSDFTALAVTSAQRMVVQTLNAAEL